jgi:hypothetical protein
MMLRKIFNSSDPVPYRAGQAVHHHPVSGWLPQQVLDFINNHTIGEGKEPRLTSLQSWFPLSFLYNDLQELQADGLLCQNL